MKDRHRTPIPFRSTSCSEEEITCSSEIPSGLIGLLKYQFKLKEFMQKLCLIVALKSLSFIKTFMMLT